MLCDTYTHRTQKVGYRELYTSETDSEKCAVTLTAIGIF